ncbi:hypothetical protein [Streptomyces sp. SD15]
MPPGEANGEQLAAWIRNHWHIENLLHHAETGPSREGDGIIRTGHLPRTMVGARFQP